MFKRLILLSIVAVVAFVGGVTVGSNIYINRGAVNQTVNVATASVMLDYGDGDVATYGDLTVGGNENLMQLMQDVTGDNHITFLYKDYSGLGALITQIGGKKNGDGSRYWQYWVNNKMAAVGASSYIVQPGDVIEWKFAPSKQ